MRVNFLGHKGEIHCSSVFMQQVDSLFWAGAVRPHMSTIYLHSER